MATNIYTQPFSDAYYTGDRPITSCESLLSNISDEEIFQLVALCKYSLGPRFSVCRSPGPFARVPRDIYTPSQTTTPCQLIRLEIGVYRGFKAKKGFSFPRIQDSTVRPHPMELENKRFGQAGAERKRFERFFGNYWPSSTLCNG